MGVYNVKQLIIIRKDLGMNKGKLAAQAAHASMGALLDTSYRTTMGEKPHGVDDVIVINLFMYPQVRAWLDGSFAKVALAVNSEEELERCYKLAKENGFPCAYIVDNGTTVFNGVKTPTCVGIGPEQSEKLDKLFGELKLY